MHTTNRRLGDLEFTYWMMDLASRTNFTVLAEVKGSLCPTEDDLIRVIDQVVSCHRLIGVRLDIDENGKLTFFPCEQPVPVRIDRMITTSTDSLSGENDITDTINEEQHLSFNWKKGPLMRTRILVFETGKTIIMLTFHHAIADARSAMAVLHDVLCAFDGKPLERTISGDNYEFEGPLEQFIPESHQGFHAIKSLLVHSVMQSMNRFFFRPSSIPVPELHWPDERTDRFILETFDEETTQRFISAAKKQQAGIHGALCAAQLLSLLEEYPSRTSIRTWLLSLVDLRKRITNPMHDNTLNLMISMVEFCQLVKRDVAFWDLARDITLKTLNHIDKGFHFRSLPAQARLIHMAEGLIKKDVNGSRHLLRLGQLSRPLAMPVSNIGTVYYPSHFEHFSVANMTFIVPLSSSGIIGSASNTFNGQLNWNYTYAWPSVSKEQATRMAHRSMDIIRKNT